MHEWEQMITEIIAAIGSGIEVFGVVVILIGVIGATLNYFRAAPSMLANRSTIYKTRLGQSLLIGLEILVAADIVRTVALSPTFASLGALGLLVIIRTFVSWTLILEVEGRWPWQPERRIETQPVAPVGDGGSQFPQDPERKE